MALRFDAGWAIGAGGGVQEVRQRQHIPNLVRGAVRQCFSEVVVNMIRPPNQKECQYNPTPRHPFTH